MRPNHSEQTETFSLVNANPYLCTNSVLVRIVDGTGTNGTGMNGGLVRMADWYEWRTGTNSGLVRMADWYEWRTGTNGGLVRIADWYEWRTGTNDGLVRIVTI
jgi:hypothetical protein